MFKKFKLLKIFIIIFSFSFSLVACVSVSKKPNWIIKGGSAFKDNKKALYGVGTVDGITSESLRRNTADNRAIAEISKQLSVMSTSLMRDYMSSTSVAEEEKQSGEQYIENTVKTFTSNTFSGIKIVDRWDNGKIAYSLAELTLTDLKLMTDELKQLNQKTKEYIKANAEKAFDKLEQEQQKQNK